MSGVSFPRLFSPFNLGGVDLRNRVVCTTHHTALAKDREFAYLKARAQGGAALFGLNAGLGVGNYGIGPGEPGGPAEWDRPPRSALSAEGIRYYDDLLIPGLRERAELLQAEGAKCFGQVAHVGAGQHWPTLRALIGPSNVPDPYDAQIPHALSEGEIEDLIFVYAQGVRRVRDAGMDAAELHGAHGYLIMQFLSPHFNRRVDRWGGPIENRVRFPLAILSAAQALVGPDFPIGIRLGYEGTGTGRGLTYDELARVSALLAPHVAYISISGGSYSGFADGFDGAYVSPWYREPAFNADSARAIRAAAPEVPLLVTGRITDPATAEALIAEGSADLVGMVRALIADPDLPAKARSGKAEQIRYCLGMSECHHIGRHRVPMTCAVNAAAGREDELRIERAPDSKTVVVIGAGPAGMEAARVAALRGHKVYLCDSENRLGGSLRWIARDPNRRHLLDEIVFFETAFHELDVELVLGHRVEPEDVLAFEADAVIVATGGMPIVPDQCAGDGVPVRTAREVLLDPSGLPDDVVVVGGVDAHVAGPTVSEFLADLGHHVTFITEQVDFAAAAEDATRFTLIDRLKRKNIEIALTTRLASIAPDGPIVEDTFGNRESRALPGHAVVLACGLEPDDALYRKLAGKVPSLQVIGDALAPRRVMHATIEGARAAMAI